MRARHHANVPVRSKSDKADKVRAIGVARARINSAICCVGYDDLSAVGKPEKRFESGPAAFDLLAEPRREPVDPPQMQER